jgi:hypothetical protein
MLSHSFKISFNIILPPMSRSSNWHFLQASPPNPSMHFSPHPRTWQWRRATYFPWFDQQKYIWGRVQSKKLSITQFSPVSCLSSLCCPNIFLCTVSSYTLSLCSSLIVRGKDAHPKKQQAILYFCLFWFLYLTKINKNFYLLCALVFTVFLCRLCIFILICY